MAPSSLVVLTLIIAISFSAIGYRVGTLSSKSKAQQRGDEPLPTPVAPEEEEADEQDDSLSTEDIPDGDLSAVSAGFLEPCKMVLIVRTDLKLSPGDIASQCGHATLACYKALAKANPGLVRHWEYTGQAKIALKAKSEDQLLELEAVAKSLNLCARAVQDPTLGENVRTVLAVGPGPVGLVNEVTGKLRLL
ncbi:hypothetical protein HYPSUDRAFT_199214 [Hypholoma sublateritium FD-334 SS-4]|uniref:peptidyl-tRNA hydrolase n=1 Tax=Hypholoma sublateritium (strain FD-334 SS-4) TaxID=945553 RepID=A0A0D2MPS9_HYPSF|nr:hypothetical protein HYPSUDRAFT_199214 [Hypholoma sublateritium FD-334 SS-4]